MSSFAFASIIHVSCRGKDNCSAMSGTERDHQIDDVSVSQDETKLSFLGFASICCCRRCVSPVLFAKKKMHCRIQEGVSLNLLGCQP